MNSLPSRVELWVKTHRGEMLYAGVVELEKEDSRLEIRMHDGNSPFQSARWAICSVHLLRIPKPRRIVKRKHYRPSMELVNYEKFPVGKLQRSLVSEDVSFTITLLHDDAIEPNYIMLEKVGGELRMVGSELDIYWGRFLRWIAPLDPTQYTKGSTL